MHDPTISPMLSFLGLAAAGVGALLVLQRLLAYFGTRYVPRPVMTANEVEFFRRLSIAHRRGFVFPQVAMSALIEPTQTGRAGLDAFRRISQKRVDYTMHDADLSLICVVELDDRTHDKKKDAERDALLARAGIPTLRWESSRRPSVAEIRANLAALSERRASARGQA